MGATFPQRKYDYAIVARDSASDLVEPMRPYLDRGYRLVTVAVDSRYHEHTAFLELAH